MGANIDGFWDMTLSKEGHLDSFTKIEMSTCEICLARKVTHKLFGKSKRAYFPLHLVYSDICGPMWFGATYFITFIDDFTHFVMSI